MQAQSYINFRKNRQNIALENRYGILKEKLVRGDRMDYKYDIALSFATEDQKLVEKVYHYLRAENLNVFFAPSQEGQKVLSGKKSAGSFLQYIWVRGRVCGIICFPKLYYASGTNGRSRDCICKAWRGRSRDSGILRWNRFAQGYAGSSKHKLF